MALAQGGRTLKYPRHYDVTFTFVRKCCCGIGRQDKIVSMAELDITYNNVALAQGGRTIAESLSTWNIEMIDIDSSTFTIS